MRARPRSWWQQHPFIAAGTIVAIVLLIAFTFAVLEFGWDWTGFIAGASKVTITRTPTGTATATELQPARTLWDWLGLLAALAIPVVVGFGAAWFTTQQTKASTEASNKQHETELEIATDNQREAVLQAYIDKISELLLKEHLGERTADGQLKPEYEQVRKIARVRTITVLSQLEARRVGYIFSFLREAELMSATEDDNAISLKNADLHAVNWSQADLRGADLRQANLSGAYLQRADLRQANLSGADLSETNLNGAIFFRKIFVPRAFGGTIVLSNSANLSGADLSGANLRGAEVTNEQLAEVASLKGATMPDGSKHP